MTSRGSVKSYIYHEQQESALCGQHCLNNLLQGPHFTAVDLAEIANTLDDMERSLQSNDPKAFYSFQSNNVDDAGNFSIQVLKTALQKYSKCDLIPWHQDPDEKVQAEMMEASHENNKAFIVNRSNHWFTIRKIRQHWWNLNSTSEIPEIISPFYLSAFLIQLRAEGYSVFLVTGTIPVQGDPELSKSYLPASQSLGKWYEEGELLGLNGVGGGARGGTIAVPAGFEAFQGKGNRLGGDRSNDAPSTSLNPDEYDEELELAKAISASLQEQTKPTGTVAMNPKEEMRLKRLAAMNAAGNK